MRGRFKEQASVEEPRRAGAEGELPRRGKRSWPGPCPRRPILQGFAISALRAAARRLRSETRPRAAKGRPYGGKQLRDVGSETAGAKAEPHQLQFSTNPGPSGPAGIEGATQILRAGNFAWTCRYASPVMGSGADSPCQGEMARRARGGRVGDYEHEVLILSRPPAILKVNCPEGAREGGLGHW